MAKKPVKKKLCLKTKFIPHFAGFRVDEGMGKFPTDPKN
jgi:hypothetical protein